MQSLVLSGNPIFAIHLQYIAEKLLLPPAGAAGDSSARPLTELDCSDCHLGVLPKGFVLNTTTGRPFYYNTKTKKGVFQHPLIDPLLSIARTFSAMAAAAAYAKTPPTLRSLDLRGNPYPCTLAHVPRAMEAMATGIARLAALATATTATVVDNGVEEFGEGFVFNGVDVKGICDGATTALEPPEHERMDGRMDMLLVLVMRHAVYAAKEGRKGGGLAHLDLSGQQGLCGLVAPRTPTSKEMRSAGSSVWVRCVSRAGAGFSAGPLVALLQSLLPGAVLATATTASAAPSPPPALIHRLVYLDLSGVPIMGRGLTGLGLAGPGDMQVMEALTSGVMASSTLKTLLLLSTLMGIEGGRVFTSSWAKASGEAEKGVISRESLTTFYKEHNTAKIQHVDTILANGDTLQERLDAYQKGYGALPRVTKNARKHVLKNVCGIPTSLAPSTVMSVPTACVHTCDHTPCSSAGSTSADRTRDSDDDNHDGDDARVHSHRMYSVDRVYSVTVDLKGQQRTSSGSGETGGTSSGRQLQAGGALLLSHFLVEWRKQQQELKQHTHLYLDVSSNDIGEGSDALFEAMAIPVGSDGAAETEDADGLYNPLPNSADIVLRKQLAGLTCVVGLQIVVLNLQRNELHDESLALLASALLGASSASSVNATDTIEGSAKIEGSTSLGALQGLTALDLSYNPLLQRRSDSKTAASPSGFSGLCSALLRHESLTSLNLSHCVLLLLSRDECIIPRGPTTSSTRAQYEPQLQLAEVLASTNGNLTSLELSSCGMLPEGAEAMAAVLRTNLTLTSIDLREETTADTFALARAGKRSPRHSTNRVQAFNDSSAFVALSDASPGGQKEPQKTLTHKKRAVRFNLSADEDIKGVRGIIDGSDSGGNSAGSAGSGATSTSSTSNTCTNILSMSSPLAVGAIGYCGLGQQRLRLLDLTVPTTHAATHADSAFHDLDAVAALTTPGSPSSQATTRTLREGQLAVVIFKILQRISVHTRVKDTKAAAAEQAVAEANNGAVEEGGNPYTHEVVYKRKWRYVRMLGSVAKGVKKEGADSGSQWTVDLRDQKLGAAAGAFAGGSGFINPLQVQDVKLAVRHVDAAMGAAGTVDSPSLDVLWATQPGLDSVLAAVVENPVCYSLDMRGVCLAGGGRAHRDGGYDQPAPSPPRGREGEGAATNATAATSSMWPAECVPPKLLPAELESAAASEETALSAGAKERLLIEEEKEVAKEEEQEGVKEEGAKEELEVPVLAEELHEEQPMLVGAPPLPPVPSSFSPVAPHMPKIDGGADGIATKEAANGCSAVGAGTGGGEAITGEGGGGGGGGGIFDFAPGPVVEVEVVEVKEVIEEERVIAHCVHVCECSWRSLVAADYGDEKQIRWGEHALSY
jgi:hypothetical protein